MKKKLSPKGKDTSEGNEKTLKTQETPQLKKRKKRGRKRKRRAFEETKLGFLLKHEAPLEYRLIMEVNGRMPTAELIEAIGYASINLLFRKPKFRRALIEYRRRGLYVKPKKCRPNAESYYASVYKHNIQNALRQIVINQDL